MKPSEEQIKAYLTSIKFTGTPDLSFDTLKKIVEGHIFTFPFETINVHDSKFGIPIPPPCNTDFNFIFNHLVVNNRGGHCVALNTLLQTMLSALSFEVTAIAPDSIWKSSEVPKSKRLKHCAALVKAQDQLYLVDAGFGGVGILSPMRLEIGEVTQFSEKFRLITSQDYPFELQLCDDGRWLTIYGFANEKADEVVYQAIDAIQSSPLHPDCYFSNLLLCTKPFKIDETHNGRYRILNDKFTIFENDKKVTEKEIASQRGLRQLLKQHFSIEVQEQSVIRFIDSEFEAFKLSHTKRRPVLFQYSTDRKKSDGEKQSTAPSMSAIAETLPEKRETLRVAVKRERRLRGATIPSEPAQDASTKSFSWCNIL